MKNHARGFSIPNFNYHCTTAHSALLANRVKLGKRTSLGSIPVLLPAE